MTCDDTDMGNDLSAHAQWANHAEALYAAKGRDPVAIAGHLDQRLGQPSNVLDAGCGTGGVLAHWPRDIDRVGFDHDPGVVQVAAKRETARLRFEVADFTTPPEGTFHSVLALFAAFQYVLDDEQRRLSLVATQSRVAPGGTFAVELGPDPDTLRPPKAVWTRWRGSDGQWWMRRAMATKIEGTLSIQFAFHRGGPASPVLLQDTHLIQPVPRDWWLAQFSEASWTVDFDQIPGGGPLLIATRR